MFLLTSTGGIIWKRAALPVCVCVCLSPLWWTGNANIILMKGERERERKQNLFLQFPPPPPFSLTILSLQISLHNRSDFFSPPPNSEREAISQFKWCHLEPYSCQLKSKWRMPNVPPTIQHVATEKFETRRRRRIFACFNSERTPVSTLRDMTERADCNRRISIIMRRLMHLCERASKAALRAPQLVE